MLSSHLHSLFLRWDDDSLTDTPASIVGESFHHARNPGISPTTTHSATRHGTPALRLRHSGRHGRHITSFEFAPQFAHFNFADPQQTVDFMP